MALHRGGYRVVVATFPHSTGLHKYLETARNTWACVES